MRKILLTLTLLFTTLLVACGGGSKKDLHQQVFDTTTITYQPGDSSISVTGNLYLPTSTDVKGATIEWVTTDPNVISTMGVVTRHQTESKSVFLVLRVTIDGVTKEKTFPITVKPLDDGGNGGDPGGGNGDGNTFTVSFNSDGGSPVANQVVAANAKLTYQTSTKEGFMLDGWYKDTNFDHKWDFANDVVTGNMTLYAKWTTQSTTIPPGYTAIGSVEDFMAIEDYTKNYILVADIDFGGAEAKPLGGWGDSRPSFSGTFDGNGYAIMNFKITGSLHPMLLEGEDSFGASLFPHLTGTLRNLNIINANIVGDGFSGGVVGLNDGSISNIYFQGKVTASKSWGSAESWAVPAGAIAGIQGGTGTISNVFVDAHVIGGHIFFGYAFNSASNLLAVKETLDPAMTLHTGQEKEGETEYLTKSFINAEVVNKSMLSTLSFGLKWSTTGATRPYLIRVDGQVPSWALV